MDEIELKLQVPAASRDAVLRAVQRGRASRVHLCAHYFDTQDRCLASVGLAARVRREGRHWVQSLKGVGDGILARLEHEVRLGRSREVPAFDASRHAGTPAGDALRDALKHRDDTLRPCFETDVWRTRRELRVAGVRIELAFDEGVLRAQGRTLSVCELELELLSGPVAGLIEVARRWATQHGLWIDVRSKADRGHWLSDGGGAAPVTKASVPPVARSDAPEAVLRECVRHALLQVMANGSWLAADACQPEQVHQARVGLRRLRSALRDFGAWTPAADARWGEGARALFSALSGARDRDALASWLWPALQQAGAPPLHLEALASTTDPGAVFRSLDTTQWLLRMLAFVHQPPAHDDDEADVRALARPILARLHRQLQRAGEDFATIEDAARHRARKRLKRLRYGAESLSMLWPAKAWARYAARLGAAQEALGRLQDATVAQALLRERAASDVGAAFALGWLAARREVWIVDAGEALRALAGVPKFLR